MKVKTAELSGRALDYATTWIVLGRVLNEIITYSKEWNHCGHLIEKYEVTCFKPQVGNNYLWRAICGKVGISDHDIKTAICRAVVASKLGDEVDIPDELMEVGE